MIKKLKVAILLTFVLTIGVAYAAPQDQFGVPLELAAAEVKEHFKCHDIRSDSNNRNAGVWTCSTKIDAGQGIGLIDLRIKVSHFSRSGSGRVVKYVFETPRRRMVRDTSFRGMVAFSQFFGTSVMNELNTQENYQTYVRGQDVYEVQGLFFEVSETSSSFKLIVQAVDGVSTRISSVANREPDEISCNRMDGMPGWQMRWSHRTASIEPVLKPISADDQMITGTFNISRDSIIPSFRPAFGRVYNGNYVTIFADDVPIYQSQWIEKREPTCCTLSVQNSMSRKLLFSMAQGTTGIVLLSRDAAGQEIIAVSRFDLGNIGKAADKAIGGQFERSVTEGIGRCER